LLDAPADALGDRRGAGLVDSSSTTPNSSPP
jgi:hypothetical protein